MTQDQTPEYSTNQQVVLSVSESAFKGQGGKIPPEKVFDHMVLFGPCARAIGHARAAVELQRSGFEGEGVALVRAAFEYAVTAQWAYFNAGGVDRLFATARADHVRTWRQLGARAGISDQVEARFRDTTWGKELPRFADILRSVDPDGFYGEQYSLLSKFSHVSGDMIAAHVAVSDEGMMLRPHTYDQYPQVTGLIMAGSALMAAWLLEDLREDVDRRKCVEKISDDHLIPCWITEPPDWRGWTP